MGANRRRIEREPAAERRAREEREQAERGVGSAHGRKLVEIWNSRAKRKARPSFYPTIETAIIAGAPWLRFMCPSCQAVGEVDLRTLDRHPLLPISGLISSLSCRWCCPNPQFAKLLALSPTPFPGARQTPRALK
jgi:hypothetical protein